MDRPDAAGRLDAIRVLVVPHDLEVPPNARQLATQGDAGDAEPDEADNWCGGAQPE